MRSVEEHLHAVLAGVVPLAPFEVPLMDGRGCVLAEDVVAPWPLPAFDVAEVEGFAVRASDLLAASDGKPVTLTVVDHVPSGYRASAEVSEGQAIRLGLGAPVPAGADAVVPLEATDAGVQQVQVRRSVAAGEFIHRRGEEVELGAVVVPGGSTLGSRETALLAAVGRGRVTVHPQPRVVVMSVGADLVDAEGHLLPGQVYDANGLSVASAVHEAGAVAYRVGPVTGDAESLLATLEDQLVRADLVVATMGASAEAYELLRRVLAELGTVEFTNVAMTPGTPQAHGTVGPDHTPLFVLPGNPVSAYVSFEIFVRPVIRRMMGHDRIYRPVVRALLTESLPSPAGRRQFARGVLEVVDGRYVVRPAARNGAHGLGALAKANALVVVPEDVTELAPGTAVAVLRLDEG